MLICEWQKAFSLTIWTDRLWCQENSRRKKTPSRVRVRVRFRIGVRLRLTLFAAELFSFTAGIVVGGTARCWKNHVWCWNDVEFPPTAEIPAFCWKIMFYAGKLSSLLEIHVLCWTYLKPCSLLEKTLNLNIFGITMA